MKTDSRTGAQEFVDWATSTVYIRFVGKKKGSVALPPETRPSTFELAEYQQAEAKCDRQRAGHIE